jgi:hypothetical protein
MCSQLAGLAFHYQDSCIVVFPSCSAHVMLLFDATVTWCCLLCRFKGYGLNKIIHLEALNWTGYS